MRPPAPGSRGEGQPVEPGEVGAEHRGAGGEHARGVERADEREEAALGVRERLHRPGGVGRRARSCRAKAVPLVPSETTTSPGASPSPRAAPMLSPVPGGDRDAGCRASHDLGRRRHPRHREVDAVRRVPEEVQAVVAGAGRPVAGAGGVAGVRRPPAGARRRRPPGCGRSASRGGARRCGPGRGSPARGARPSAACSPWSRRRARPRWRPPRPRRRARRRASAAASAERVSFHSRAGRTTSPASSSSTMPCCWPPTASAETPSSSPSDVASSHAVHQWRGSTSVPSGWAARPARTTSPVSASHTTTLHDWVEVSTPATSGRWVMGVLPDGGCRCVRGAGPRTPILSGGPGTPPRTAAGRTLQVAAASRHPTRGQRARNAAASRAA